MFRGSTFISNQQQVAPISDHDLLLKSAALGALLLHIRPGEIAMNQGGFARRQRPNNAQSQIGNPARQSPFLTIDERVYSIEEFCMKSNLRQRIIFRSGLTFNGHHVFPHLLREEWVRDQFNEIVNGVNGGMDRLEPLNFMADRVRMRERQMSLRGHAAQTQLIRASVSGLIPAQPGFPATRRGITRVRGIVVNRLGTTPTPTVDAIHIHSIIGYGPPSTRHGRHPVVNGRRH